MTNNYDAYKHSLLTFYFSTTIILCNIAIVYNDTKQLISNITKTYQNMERLPKDNPDYDPLEHNPDYRINPRINTDIIRAEAERLLAKMTTDRKGLFLVKESNDWLEEAKHQPTPTMLFDELWHEG